MKSEELRASLWMEAFSHFITSNMCFLDLDLGQKGFQKSLGAFSIISGAWRLSCVRVGHAVTSSGVFLITRSLRSCVRIICVLLMARVRVSHAFASLSFRTGHAAASSMRSRRCQFLQNLHFVLSFHFCMFSFHPLSHSCLRRSETTQHMNHDIEWK